VTTLAIGAGYVKNEAAVRAVSREGDRVELLRGPLFYTVGLYRLNPVDPHSLKAPRDPTLEPVK
jgi:hypothetical protein